MSCRLEISGFFLLKILEYHMPVNQLGKERTILELSIDAPKGKKFTMGVIDALVPNEDRYTVVFSNEYTTLTWHSKESLSGIPDSFLRLQINKYLIGA